MPQNNAMMHLSTYRARHSSSRGLPGLSENRHENVIKRQKLWKVIMSSQINDKRIISRVTA